MNCTIFSNEKTMGIRKLGGDNTEKKNLQTYVQIMRIKKMTERGTSYDSNKNRQILFRNAPYLPPPPPTPSNFFYFSRVLQPSQEKLKTKLMQNFLGKGEWGVNKVHYERCATGECIITGENLTGIN